MERSVLVFLALSICMAQCSTIRGKDNPHEHHKRGKRSCHYCDEGAYPGPVYHSLEFSGLARNDDGTPQGIYSGAAAAANLGGRAAVPSYSLASSVTNAGADAADVTGTALGTGAALGVAPAYAAGATLGFGAALGTGAAYGAGATLGAPAIGLAALGAGAYNGARAASQTAAYGVGGRLTERSIDFSSQQPENIGHVGGGTTGFGGQNKFSGSGSSKEEHFTFHSGGGTNFAGNGENESSYSQNLQGSNSFGSQSFGSSGNGGNEQQVQQSEFDHGHGDRRVVELSKEDGQQQLQSSGHGQWQQGDKFSSSSQSSSSGAGSNVFGSQSSGSAGYGGNQQQVQQSGFNHGHGDKHEVELLKENGQQQLQSAGHGQWQQGNQFSSSSQSSSSAGSTGHGYGGSMSGARPGAFNGGTNFRFEHNAPGSGFDASSSRFSSGRAEQATIGTSGSGSGYRGFGEGFGARNTGSLSGQGDQASLGTSGSGYKASGAGFEASVVGSSAGASDESVGAGVSESQYERPGYQSSRVGYTALNGALNLASQGLQTAGEAGCSTCGRSSYAFSTAKSKTGDAVAVSIGG